MLACLVSLGQPAIVPVGLLAVNVAAIVGTVAATAWLLRERGLPTWPSLVSSLYAGQALTLARDLSDPLAVFWLALAFVALRRGNWYLTATALALGLLTRESILVFALCFAAPLLLERRWRQLAYYLAITFAPYVSAQVILHQWLGTWAFQESARSNALAPLPFAGLSAAPSGILLVIMFCFACVPALIGIVLGARSLPRGARKRDALHLVAALSAALHGVALLFPPAVHWLDLWEPLRLAAPLCVLLPLLRVPGEQGRLVRGTQALMLASAVLALLL